MAHRLICLAGLLIVGCAAAPKTNPPKATSAIAIVASAAPTPERAFDAQELACFDIAERIADIVCSKAIIDDRLIFNSKEEEDTYREEYRNSLAKAGTFDKFVYRICIPRVTQKFYDCVMASTTLVDVDGCVQKAKVGR